MISNNTCHRIMIFGLPGSGKTTLALYLNDQLTLPVVHIDDLLFTKNRKEIPYEDFLQKLTACVEQKNWIIEGNAWRSFEMRFCKADVVLYFRFNRLLCTYRLCKRLLNKNNQDKLSYRLLRYLWAFNRRFKPLIQSLRDQNPQVVFLEIRNKTDLTAFLSSFFKIKPPQ